MKTTVTLLAALLLTGVASGAGEGSLLERLDEECRALAARADAAVAEIRVPVATSWKALPDPRKAKDSSAIGTWLLVYGEKSIVRSAPRAAVAVLVGTPPVLVTSAHAVGSTEEIQFRLADGTEGRAKLRVREQDLGVAVYALPDDVAAGREGLEPSPRVERGRIAVVPGHGTTDVSRSLDLALVRGCEPLGGLLRVDGLEGSTPPGTPALGADGRLLGIAASWAGEAGRGSTWPHTSSFHDAWGSPIAYFAEPARLDERSRLALSTLAKLQAREGKGVVYLQPGAQAPRRLPRGSFVAGPVIARVLEDLEAHGRVRHAYLGVVLGPMKGEGASRGVEIRSVLDGSPAAGAGIAAGATVRAVNGRRVDGPDLLARALVLARPGDAMTLGLVGSDAEVRVVLGDREEAGKGLLSPTDLGLVCMDLGAELARFLELGEGTRGVVVRAVVPGSPAAKAGITRGQVVVGGAGEPIADLEELEAAVAGAKGKIEIEIVSGEGTKKIEVRIPASRIGSRAR